MTEMSDWVWLIVGGIWVVTRILPRLFRSRSSKEEPEEQKPLGDPEVESAEEAPSTSLPPLPSPLPPLGEQGGSMSGQLPPIEPR